MPESIVVGTDGSDTAKRAVEEAIRLAGALGAELHVVSAFEPLRGSRVAGAPKSAAEIRAPLPDAHVETVLGEAAAVIRARGVVCHTHAAQQDPADAVLGLARKLGASMIIVGNKGMHGAGRLVLGNVPNRISHKAGCSVLIVSTDRAEADGEA
jgi:nucleotide-binding universal stress UspA family protein